jgi:hypothetical protein
MPAEQASHNYHGENRPWATKTVGSYAYGCEKHEDLAAEQRVAEGNRCDGHDKTLGSLMAASIRPLAKMALLIASG